jgi:predicted ATPase
VIVIKFCFQELISVLVKQWADPSHGYTVSLKYGAPIYGVTLPLVVTSNYTPAQLLPNDQKYPMTELMALERRFEIIHIDDLLQREGLRLRTKEEIKALKKSKNADFSKVFINLKEKAEADKIEYDIDEIRERRNDYN